MATLVFCCGGECGIGATGAHWSGLPVGCTFDTTTKRTGTRSLRSNPAAQNSFFDTAHLTLFSGAVGVCRFYINIASHPTGDSFIGGINPIAASTAGGLVYKSADGKYYAGASAGSGTIGAFGATGITLSTGVWYRVDVKFNGTSNPNLIDVQVDGTALGQASNATAASNPLYLRLGSDGTETFDIYFDDIAASTTSADYPLGAGHVDNFVPTADGTHNIAGTGDFQRGTSGVDIVNATTTAFQLVDDIPLPSSVTAADSIAGIAPANPATDYVECVFGPAPGVSTPTVGPRGVDVVLAYHQAATQTGQMQVKLNDNGTLNTTFDTGAASGVATLRYACKSYGTAPSTGGAWDVAAGNANFNNLRFRFFAPDAAPDQFLDAIMIEAEFADAPPAAFMPRSNPMVIGQAVNRASTF